MTTSKKYDSVADVLERDVDHAVKEWLRRVNLVAELTTIPLSDVDRTGHLPKLYHDLIGRLRLAKDAKPPISRAAAEHGKVRVEQGYSVGMLIDESRLFEVSTFHTLNLHQSELEQEKVLLDVMVIADEVDAQLKEPSVPSRKRNWAFEPPSRLRTDTRKSYVQVDPCSTPLLASREGPRSKANGGPGVCRCIQ